MLEGRRFQLPAESPERPIRYTVFVKFAPGLPAFLKNYILVLSKIPFWLYFGASFIFSFAYYLILSIKPGLKTQPPRDGALVATDLAKVEDFGQRPTFGR
jgi:hypothetical protein